MKSKKIFLLLAMASLSLLTACGGSAAPGVMENLNAASPSDSSADELLSPLDPLARPIPGTYYDEDRFEEVEMPLDYGMMRWIKSGEPYFNRTFENDVYALIFSSEPLSCTMSLADLDERQGLTVSLFSGDVPRVGTVMIEYTLRLMMGRHETKSSGMDMDARYATISAVSPTQISGTMDLGTLLNYSGDFTIEVCPQ